MRSPGSGSLALRLADGLGPGPVPQLAPGLGRHSRMVSRESKGASGSPRRTRFDSAAARDLYYFAGGNSPPRRRLPVGERRGPGPVMTDLSTAPSTRLFTLFDSAIYVDTASGELRHGALETSPANAALVAEPGARRAGRIMHLSDGAYHPVVCRMEGSKLLADAPSGDDGGTLLEVVALERGLLGLRAGGHFLCGEPDGRLTLSRTACSL